MAIDHSAHKFLRCSVVESKLKEARAAIKNNKCAVQIASFSDTWNRMAKAAVYNHQPSYIF